MNKDCNFYWNRVYDYDHERDADNKGTLIDEFYLKDVVDGREEVKNKVREQYCTHTASKIKFAKPNKKSSGLYAIVMESNRFYYDRFYAQINTFFFWCHKQIQG